ncbi:MAG TPA: F0F1 ATP synthase subunit B [Phycisphaerales bacterium]|nr:F0F1 ATP synthase subunit B [Phycisphaerales bacterium]
MRSTVRFALAIVAPLALAGIALAQHGATEAGHAAGEHAAAPKANVVPSNVPDAVQQGVTPMLVAIGVFLVVFGILSVKVWPTIVNGLRDREMKIRSSIEEAEAAQRQARAALAQYEANLAAARAEAQKMLDDAKLQQQAIGNELKAKADVELAAMRDKAKREIDAARAAAIADIHAHATSLATAMAGKILKREINAGDQARLIQESLQEMGAGRA